MNSCYNQEMEEALIDMESNPCFIEKYVLDELVLSNHSLDNGNCHAKKSRENAWVRKRMHKKRRYRRYLTLNSHLDFDRLCGTNMPNGIYLDYHGSDFEDYGTYVSNRDMYNINPYERIYYSFHGDLRVYHGRVVHALCGRFFAVSKYGYKNTGRITNRRVRRIQVLEDDKEPGSRSYYKKLCGPFIDLW